MRLTAEAVVETLLIANRKAGRFLVMERAARFPFMPRFLQLDRAHDNAGKRHTRTKFIQPLRGKRHASLLLGKRRFHQTASLAHIEFCTVAGFELGHDLAHVFDAFRAHFSLDRFDRGGGVGFAHLLR